MKKDIHVPNVDINLLRKQSAWVSHALNQRVNVMLPQDIGFTTKELLNGLQHLLEEMVDIAEGYRPPAQSKEITVPDVLAALSNRYLNNPLPFGFEQWDVKKRLLYVKNNKNADYANWGESDLWADMTQRVQASITTLEGLGFTVNRS